MTRVTPCDRSHDSRNQHVLIRATLGERRGAQSYRSKGMAYDSGTAGTSSESIVDSRARTILYGGPALGGAGW